jgi:hypothetical protein
MPHKLWRAHGISQQRDGRCCGTGWHALRKGVEVFQARRINVPFGIARHHAARFAQLHFKGRKGEELGAMRGPALRSPPCPCVPWQL